MESLESKLKRLEKLEKEAELNKLRKQLPHKYTPLYQWQRDFVNSHNKLNFMTASNQPLLVDELIPTPSGFKRNGDLVIGDKVFGSDGKATSIVSVTDKTEVDEYRITFDDGSSIIAGPEHKWICKGDNQRFRKDNGHGGLNKTYNKWQVKTTLEIVKSGKYDPETKPRLRHVIPICQPVEYEEKKFIYDPYLLGCLIGDGSMRSSVTITSMDDDIIKAFGGSVQTLYNKKGNKASSGCVIGAVPIMKELGLYGSLSYTKFIPSQYKLGSIEQRKALLAGLLDTDGCVDIAFKQYTYCTTSPQLRDDFIELLNSLGGVVNSVRSRFTKYSKGTKTGRESFTISFKTTFNPFRIERKASKWKKVDKYKHERIIYKIEKTGKKSKMMCITVDNEDHSYLASNQYIVTHNSGKSVSLIVKAIIHATEPELWSTLWPEMIEQGKEPTQFWYLLEDRAMISREFETKWIKEWLPRGEARHKGKYRWEYKRKDKSIEYLHFLETDVKIYFFSYGQGVHSLQASTVYEIFVDEEIPFDQYDELSARLTIPRGIFNAAFTATKGQEEWRETMEEIGRPEERFKTAYKKQISVWDCKVKEDGSKGLYDDELIALRMSQCSTHNEVLKRMHGKFVKAEGLMVPEFDLKRHFVKGHKLNKKAWSIWGGIDAGSGGDAHPAGIVIVAVNDECTKARVIKCWRGDKQSTTHTQIIEKYKEMTKGLDMVGCVYDKQSRDLFLTGASLGISLIPANKQRDEGFGTLNSLFKHDMLKIYYAGEGDETNKLKNELMSYSHNHSKSKSSTPDNLIDPLRYLCMQIIWNFDKVINYALQVKDDKPKHYTSLREEAIEAQQEGRLSAWENSEKDGTGSLVEEINEWAKYHEEF